MIKRKALGFILTLIIVTVSVPPLAGQDHWTVMIYMDGDNNLEGAAIDDFNELEDAGSDANVDIVVQIDRHPVYDTSNGNWDTTKRFYVTADPNGYPDITNTIQSTEIADLGELNMGHPQTLIDFVNWARTTYPADHYLLVLWDHGDGWKTTRFAQVAQKKREFRIQKKDPLKGICYDDTDGDYLSTPDLSAALNSITSGGANPVDVVGFDACLMAMLEIAYEISPYSSYMVGSEESELFDGWDYQATMNWLVANPTSTPDVVASQIVIDYMNFYGVLGADTQSAIDLSQIPALAGAVNTLAADLINNITTYFYDIRDARDQVEEYMDADFVDLYHLAQLFQTEISDPLIQADAQNVMNAVLAAVIQEGHGIFNPDSHGISVYYPYGKDDYLSSYETATALASDTFWDEFLQTYYSTVPPPIHAIALIDDDNGRYLSQVEDYYLGTLDGLGVPYDYYDAGLFGSPSLAYLQAHSLVIWFTGSDFSTTLSPEDENNLIQFLNGGGKLFLSSQDYIWDLRLDSRYPSTFLRSYLHALGEIEDTGVNFLAGVTGNYIGDAIGPVPMCWALQSQIANQVPPQQATVRIHKIVYNPNAVDYSGAGYPDIPSYVPPLDPAPGLVPSGPDLLPNFQISDGNFSGTCVPGDTLVFYIEVHNGTAFPLSVQVEDDIPVGLINAAVSPPGVINDTNGDTIIGNGGDTVVWNIVALPTGYTLLAYTAFVPTDGSVNFGSSIINDNAVVHYSHGGLPATATANSVTVLVQAAQLIKEAFADSHYSDPAGTIVDGNTLFYRLTVFNTVHPLSPAPYTADITDITDVIPVMVVNPQYLEHPPGLNPQPIVANTISWQGSNLLTPGTSIYGSYYVAVPLGSSGVISNTAALTYVVSFPPPGSTTVTTTSNMAQTVIQTACSFIDYADGIIKDAGSENCFSNEQSEYVGINYSGDHEVVFFAFRFEGISTSTERQEIMRRIIEFLGPLATLDFLPSLFDTNTYFVAGDSAYCTDVLGSAKIAFALAQAGTTTSPEGRTDLTLTQTEHNLGNLIPVGGPAVNPIADEFDIYFGITYTLAGTSFEIRADYQLISLDTTQYTNEDVAIVYLGRHSNRYVLLVWGYGWRGTYAASVFLGNTANWETFSGYHMVMLRWTDSNADGLVQEFEITVEGYT